MISIPVLGNEIHTHTHWFRTYEQEMTPPPPRDTNNNQHPEGISYHPQNNEQLKMTRGYMAKILSIVTSITKMRTIV